MSRNDVHFGGVGYGYDAFPSDANYHEELKYFDPDPLARAPTKVDPYLPIMNEPMGYGYNEKNFESSLDTVSNYRYQPAPRGEEKYYPTSMLNDRRVDTQYERFLPSMDESPVQLVTGGARAWWMPTYLEVGIFLVLIIIVLVIKCMVLSNKVAKLEKKKDKLEAELGMQKAVQSVVQPAKV